MEAPRLSVSLSRQQEVSYDRFFQQLDIDGTGLLSEDRGTVFFGRSRLPLTILCKIWSMCDVDNDGQLNMYEFRVAMHIVHFLLQAINSIRRQTPSSKRSRPSTDGSEESESDENEKDDEQSSCGVPTEKLHALLPEKLPSLLHTYIEYESQKRNLSDDQGSTSRAHGRSGPLSPTRTSNPDGYDVDDAPSLRIIRSDVNDRKYMGFFRKLDMTREGFVSERVGTLFFSRSKLPMKALGQIWTLSDIDKDGKLDMEEFILAMYLIEISLEGKHLPIKLPESVIPESKRQFYRSSAIQKAKKVGVELHPVQQLMAFDRKTGPIRPYLENILNYIYGHHPSDYLPFLTTDDFQACRRIVDMLQHNHEDTAGIILQIIGSLVEQSEHLATPMVEAGLVPYLIKIISKSSDTRRIYASLIMSWLCVHERIPFSEQHHIDAAFCESVIKLTMESPEDETDHHFRLLLALYRQQKANNGNELEEKIIDNPELHEFIPLLIKMLNRMEVEPSVCCQLLIDIVNNPESNSSFYVNDIKVLIDIVLRELRNLSPGNQVSRLLFTTQTISCPQERPFRNTRFHGLHHPKV
eukprot:TRINITY_DN3957_c0_g2_i2.p1 TRINITY_DN3957_c0_g2~~TRINITY_DN3957_c0_g2_i2.p1  ORF type:complete len:580 (-),score=120.60 TRINITY_DN3957_c0_g2_i2:938-2677(-)